MQLSHIDENGQANMVDVSGKEICLREASAQAYIIMQKHTLELILEGKHHKGDVFAVAKVAGIQAAKQTAQLIPLCHPLALSKIHLDLEVQMPFNRVAIRSYCKLAARTGVEMEALTAASIAALTLYDMCKAVDKTMSIEQVKLLHKEKTPINQEGRSDA